MKRLLNPYAYVGVVIVVMTLLGAWQGFKNVQQRVGAERAIASHVAELERQKTEARVELAVQVAKTLAMERALQTLKNEREVEDARNTKIVAQVGAALRDAAGPAGRLRDPHATVPRCRSSGGSPAPAASAPAGNRAGDAAQAGGLFSGPATALLQRTTAESDTINNAYASCRTDAINLREQLNDQDRR